MLTGQAGGFYLFYLISPSVTYIIWSAKNRKETK